MQSVPLTVDPVEHWLDNFDSKVSKAVHKAKLDEFCERNKTTPIELILTARKVKPGEPQAEIEHEITQFADSRLAEGLAKSTVIKEIGIIRGYFKGNYVMLGRMPKRLSGNESVYESRRTLTPEEVKAMIGTQSLLHAKLVISMSAQAAQRVGILAALKHSMIQEVQGFGIVKVPPDLENRKGQLVNKTRNRYIFGLIPESLQLVNQIREDGSDWVFPIGKRQMQAIISEAAEKAGIQRAVPRKLAIKDNEGNVLRQRKWHEVHHHIFRAYFKSRMRKAGVVDNELLNYILGHKPAYGGTYDRFSEPEILEAYVKAEQYLKLLS